MAVDQLERVQITELQGKMEDGEFVQSRSEQTKGTPGNDT